MDPRWLMAVRVSTRWYDDMAELHGIPTAVDDGLWHALAAPPPLHSAAKTLRPGVPRDEVLRAVEPFPEVAVADSFADLDLAGDGFGLLIDARWIHRPGAEPSPLPPGWRRVSDPVALEAWTAGHGTPAVFPVGILGRDRFALMGRYDERGALTCGFVVHDAGEAVGVSNVFTEPDAVLDWGEALRVAGALHPGRPVTDYTGGADLEAACGAGFTAVGTQRVWLRGG